jgi:starvation-inducible DNA-binding protein
MKTDIGIAVKDEKAIAECLNAILSDEYVLITKTRNYHWHIHSKSFMELHKLYEGQYHYIKDIIDELAERVLQLGQKAAATMKEFLELTRLKEGPYTSRQDEQTKVLLADHESMIKKIRSEIKKIDEEYDDPVTVDMLTKYLGWHEKTAWMLRSYTSI